VGIALSLPSLYDLQQRPTYYILTPMRRGAKRYTVKLTSEGLVNWFLAEVVSLTAGRETYADAAEAIEHHFGLFKHLSRSGDFHLGRTLPRPRPLDLFIDPHVLYGHFCSWLRSHEVDPDTVTVPNYPEP
jgi:hypothetical protein